MGRERLRAGAVAYAAALLLAVAACSGGTAAEQAVDEATPTPTGSATGPADEPADEPSEPADEGSQPTDTPGEEFTVADPGPFEPPLRTPDVLVTSTKPIPASVQRRVRALRGVAAAVPMSVASL